MASDFSLLSNLYQHNAADESAIAREAQKWRQAGYAVKIARGFVTSIWGQPLTATAAEMQKQWDAEISQRAMYFGHPLLHLPANAMDA